jgi:hypothetical protein
VSLMNSEPGWEQKAKELGAGYLFWGPLEETNYPDSAKEWEERCRLVAEGSWGRIYDLRSLSLLEDSSPQELKHSSTRELEKKP